MKKVIGNFLEVKGEFNVKKKRMKNSFKYREILGASKNRIYLEVISLEKKETFTIDFVKPKDYWTRPIVNRRITNKGDIVETNVFSCEKLIKIDDETLRIPYQWEIDRHESVHFPESENAKIYNTISNIVKIYNKK